MEPKFINKEKVKYNDPKYGIGNGCVVGMYKDSDDRILYIIYPKTPPPNLKYMCFTTDEKNLISTPF